MDWVTEVLDLSIIVPWLLGMVFGIFVGATPGLTATMAVALILPISYQLGEVGGLAIIIGVSFTAIFAGDIPATFLRIPGTPASATAVLDGYQLNLRGKGRLALMLNLFCSSLGGLIGVTVLVLSAPRLADYALKFVDHELFWLTLFGISISALVSTGSTWKGIVAAALGLLISMPRMDLFTAADRFTFGIDELLKGIQFIPAMIGLFGLSEVFRILTEPEQLHKASVTKQEQVGIIKTLRLMWEHKRVIMQSAFLGTGIGALPGAGADIAAWGAYGVARQSSKDPESFGSGVVVGVVAPTSANNAAVAGAWIPALVFGIPGDAVTAIMLGAMQVHNIQPGVELFTGEDSRISSVFMIAFVTQFFLLIAGYLGIRAFGAILRVPRRIILVGVVVFSIVGAYAYQNSMFDVYVMFAFGVLGFYLEKKSVPLAPLILGLILGERLEQHYRRAMIKDDDISLFFTRPVCQVLVTLLVIAFAAPVILRVARVLRKNKHEI